MRGRRRDSKARRSLLIDKPRSIAHELAPPSKSELGWRWLHLALPLGVSPVFHSLEGGLDSLSCSQRL
jgi:hypothetical protein